MKTPPARWPKMLDRRTAAEYCGVSVNHFLTHCPVAPTLIGGKKLWNRRGIDAWLDGPIGGGENLPSAEEWLERA